MFWKPFAWAFAHGSGPCGPHSWKHGHHKHWKRSRSGPGDEHQSHSRGGHHGHHGHWGRGPWGVRRPLRFMARQLDLDESQVAELAAILDDLKMQRAQARLDRRRAVSVFADVFLEDTFDAERVKEACSSRADSERAVEEAVAKALERTFALLDEEQRKRLSYLLRSEGLTI